VFLISSSGGAETRQCRSSCRLLRGSQQRGRMHRHSPLMRSLFSQFQTPTAPRRAVGFFRSGCPSGCPAWLITQSTSGQQFYSPSNSAFASRHARLEHGIRLRCDVSPLLPAAGFTRLRINAPVRVRYHSGRSLLFDAAFPSPAATADLATSLRSQVNVPGLHLQSNSEASSGPFGFALPPPVCFFSPPGARSTCKPVARSDSRTPCLTSKSPLPSGTSRSLGLVAPNLVSNREAYHCESPDLPSLPVAPK